METRRGPGGHSPPGTPFSRARQKSGVVLGSSRHPTPLVARFYPVSPRSGLSVGPGSGRRPGDVSLRCFPRPGGRVVPILRLAHTLRVSQPPALDTMGCVAEGLFTLFLRH